MEANVLLTIKGQQWREHEKPQEILLTTEGSLIREGDTWRVVYDESPATGLEGTQTSMQVFDDGSVVLSRTGTYPMQLTFQAGSRHITRMDTPYGNLDVSVYTSLVKSQISNEGGYIQLGYTIDFSNNESVNTRLDVQIRQRAS